MCTVLLQGARLLDQFRRILDDRQVFDMMEQDPTTGKAYGAARGLKLYGKLPNLSVLVCGGDGSVGWVRDVNSSIACSYRGAVIGVALTARPLLNIRITNMCVVCGCIPTRMC